MLLVKPFILHMKFGSQWFQVIDLGMRCTVYTLEFSVVVRFDSCYKIYSFGIDSNITYLIKCVNSDILEYM